MTQDAQTLPDSAVAATPADDAGQRPAPAPVETSGRDSDDRALDVLAYVASLKRFIRPAAIVAILVFALGVAYSLTRPTSYAAEVTVQLVPGEVSTDPEAVQQAAVLPMVVRSYVQLATSPLVLDPVAKASGVENLTAQQLAPHLTVGYPANSLLLRFTFIDTDPDNAAKMSNAIADEFVKQVPTFGAGADGKVQLSAKVIYRPALPLKPLPSTRTQNLLLSLVGALGVGLMAAIVLDVVVGRVLPSEFVRKLRGSGQRSQRAS